MSPIPGGTDWGRDADVHDGTGGPPLRLMVTKSRDFKGIRANMVSGLESLRQHSVPFERVILANPGKLSETQRAKLRAEAAKYSASIEVIFDRGYFASNLRRDGEWRVRLLGLSGDPITVSRVPWRFAESPTSQVPLVGRDDLIKQISAGEGDVILYGKPGVGKTRVLAELPNVVFVDPGAAENRLADDIRMITPEMVVIDDGGQAGSQVRLLQRLRRQEADWLRFRLVVACWPDETESVREFAPGAEEIELELLERPEIDTIIRSMGVTGIEARREILDQAEGRPGWAVALADLLLRSGWDDLLSGKALLGQVQGYLQRAQLSGDALDILAVVGALRHVDEDEMTNLAKTVGVSRSKAAGILRLSARGGLLDVEQHGGRAEPLRRYSVRPPMLASAVATGHYFLGDVTLGDIDDLLDEWPHRHVDIVVTTCVAAQLGSERAISRIDRLVDGVLTSNLSSESKYRVRESYLPVSADCASRVVADLRKEFQELGQGGKVDGRGLQAMVELAYRAARLHFDREAVRLLLDIAILDIRDVNPNPDHPLRKLEELCKHLPPDTVDTRFLVGSTVQEFLGDDPDESHWRVWGAVVDLVLSPHVRGTIGAPEDAHRFTLIDSLMTPSELQVISDQLWPPIRDRLSSAPLDVAAGRHEVLHEWLRVGGGFDHPMGYDHSEGAIKVADAAGRSMFNDLIAMCGGNAALAARVVDTAFVFALEVPTAIVHEVEENPFLRDVDLHDDWQAAVDLLRADIAVVVAAMQQEPAEEVVGHLTRFRAEARAAGRMWPDRITMACKELADKTDDPEPLVRAALQRGLFPEAAPFVDRLVTLKPPGFETVIRDCLGTKSARIHTLSALLSNPPNRSLLSLAIESLTSCDFDLLDLLVIRGQLSLEVQIQVLQNACDGARGAFAVALAGRTENPAVSIGDQLLEGFLEAVLEIRPEELNGRAGLQLRILFSYLAEAHPEVLTSLLRRRLEEAGPAGSLSAWGYDVWAALEALPRVYKATLLLEFAEPQIRWLLLPCLVGRDADWLGELLDEDIIKPEEALGVRGIRGLVPIDRLATLLVPRGVEPSRIAYMAMFGTSWGEESERYQRLSEQFEEMAASEDRSIAAVGGAGV